jgi:hypothetical protein
MPVAIDRNTHAGSGAKASMFANSQIEAGLQQSLTMPE